MKVTITPWVGASNSGWFLVVNERSETVATIEGDQYWRYVVLEKYPTAAQQDVLRQVKDFIALQKITKRLTK